MRADDGHLHSAVDHVLLAAAWTTCSKMADV